MPRKQLRFGRGFSVALGNARAQAATMVLAPGDVEGGPDNRHRGSDQWPYVLSGKGNAFYLPPAYTDQGDPLPRGRR